LAGKGYPWYHPVGCIIPCGLVVILDIILVPRFGIVGAALGNSLAYISAVLVFSIGFYKYNFIKEDVCLKAYWATIQGYWIGWLSRPNSKI
jgi:O-antigen/teichoic acid export membrane protein